MAQKTHFLKARSIALFLLLLFSLSQVFAYTELEIIRYDQAPQQVFGFSVGIENNRAIVGAYHDMDPDTDVGNGSASFASFNGVNWQIDQKIYFDVSNVPAGVTEVGFGYKVAIQGNTAMISAPWDQTGNTLNGAVYYYHYNGEEWEFRQKIMGSVQGGYDDFGIDLAFDGNTLVVGASGTDLVPWTTTPTEMNYGAAYVFRKVGDQWVEEQKLVGSEINCFDQFGSRVSIHNNTIAISAPYAGPFNPSNIHQEGPGKVYVYNYDGTEWVESQILAATDGSNGDWYGRSVKITDDKIIVGALRHNFGGTARGAVYSYNLDGSNWAFSQKLTPTPNSNINFYGSSVDSEDGRLAVGCGYWGNPNNGAVYVYDLNDDQWELNSAITHSNPTESGDDLGNSVAMHQGRIIAGAPWHGGWAGSAFIFHFENMAPVANAGPAQSVTGGDLVTLNGSDSFDYEDDEISYLWTSPEGITLSNNTVVNPTFTAPETDLPFIDLEFSLMVNDGNSNSLPAYVTITVLNDNLMPIADAGESNTVLATTNYILDGTGSYDPEGEDITYMWTAPEGIVLSDNASATPHFTAPEVDEATNLTFTLVVNDGQFDSFPSNVTIKVMPILPVINLEFDEETFTFSWNPPGAMEKVFRYDDGIVLNALGAENSTAVLGVTFYEDSIIDKVSWYLTTDAGYHEYVNILITGLNDDGSPDVENILYQEDNVTSDDLIWNHYTLPEPITAPNGFFLGLNYDGFLALAIDDGVDAPYVFQNGTHWAAMNWTNGQWQKLEDMGFRNNFLLRASGLSFGVLDRANQHATRSKIDNDFKLIQIPTAYPIYTAEIERHEHFQNEYNIYIDGELIEASYTDRDYTVSNISNGQHTFAITAVYENYIESDAVLYDFIYSGSDVNDIISLDKPFIKNYPNPFNPSTTISFNLKQDSQVSLIVYNVKGQRVTQLVSQNLKSGIHNFVWDGKTSEGKDSASGIYFYQLQTNYDNRIGKMMLIK